MIKVINNYPGKFERHQIFLEMLREFICDHFQIVSWRDG